MTGRVLVVDDDPNVQEILREFLTAKGYEEFTAGDGSEGLRLAAAERPDLILMDVQLPGMTGYEVTHRLKANPATAAIPVLALTASAMRGDELKAREAGCDGYLTKPLDLGAFRKTLRALFPPGLAESREARSDGG